VVFARETRVEDMGVHATPADFLAPDAGAVTLRGADRTLLDEVAWGAGQARAVSLGRGGLSVSPSELPPGPTIVAC
jgi:hypothetical protein